VCRSRTVAEIGTSRIEDTAAVLAPAGYVIQPLAIYK